MYDKALSADLLTRRIEQMIESPFYDMILDEGRAEGRAQGIQHEKLVTARKMLAMGMELTVILNLTELSETVLRENGVLE